MIHFNNINKAILFLSTGACSFAFFLEINLKTAGAFLIISFILGSVLHKYLAVSIVNIFDRNKNDIKTLIKFDPGKIPLGYKIILLVLHIMFASMQVIFTAGRLVFY
jgi:hypothetical protein